ncbi:TetR/AcrR family transcriptional regulator [Nocardiopsis sp. JB363]|uniref:TetR/AcrR family transcriptional regulator n=1 Tax=Nocardiopsis sp. JB363 TaxID=1434837 RepID=UPI00097A8176|nr:TetR/AcrR family transcriptional regulator [Nocardiopsis sp. JB363]SIO85499.1 Transcriptional regulator, TetR family [Nocardiopsis sp. JB363]
MSVESNDHRKRPRRRGDALLIAIFEATITELDEHGYAGLTMERVAERARASKASLYRRWNTRSALVMDAVYHLLPDPEQVPDTGELRGDLLALLRQNAAMLDGPAGSALRGLLAEALPDPEHGREIRARSQGRGRRMMAEAARRAVARGEIRPEAVIGPRLDVGQALLRNHFLFQGSPLDDELVVEIVDTVLLPLFHAPAWTFVPVRGDEVTNEPREDASSEGERARAERPAYRG